MAEKLESLGFGDIVISVKSSNVKLMVESTRLIHQTLPYPLHLGVTEAGLGQAGLVKSAVGSVLYCLMELEIPYAYH